MTPSMKCLTADECCLFAVLEHRKQLYVREKTHESTPVQKGDLRSYYSVEAAFLRRYLRNVKRPRKYSKTKSVKSIARERLGSPNPARIVDDKPAGGKPKHKKKWTEED